MMNGNRTAHELLEKRANLEEQNSKEMGSPCEFEPYAGHVAPGAAILGHAGTGDAYQGFDPITQTSRSPRNRLCAQ